MSSLGAITLNESARRSQRAGIPWHWEVLFPLDSKLCCTVIHDGLARKYGVISHPFSENETRFVVRGDLESREDLWACLQAAERDARDLKSVELVTQEKVRPDWYDAALVFQQCGFKVLDESWIFECPFGPFVQRVNRLMGMLERHCVIPDEARVTNLHEGRELARAILERASLMDGFDFDHRLGAGAGRQISADYSQLVWMGPTLIGVILVAPAENDGTYEIPIRYIVPAFRQTWVNALLIHSCVKRGEAMGATTIRFNANSKTHHETIHLAKQAGCVSVATSHRYGKLLI